MGYSNSLVSVTYQNWEDHNNKNQTFQNDGFELLNSIELVYQKVWHVVANKLISKPKMIQINALLDWKMSIDLN